jgi:(2Fe-2S) ferredoxin
MGELEKHDLFADIMVTGTFCMGPCQQGPTVVVYPEGIWYGGVTAGDVSEIVQQHLQQGAPVERLRIHR